MADNNTLALTDQQIELCDAFSRATNRFVSFISLEAEMRQHEGKDSFGQFSSEAAGQAVYAEGALIDEDFVYSNSTRYVGAVKEGAQFITDSIFQAPAGNVSEDVQVKLRNNVLIKLLSAAVALEYLPREILAEGYSPSDIPDKLALKL